MCHSTLTPARTPRLHYTCHSTLTPARTSRLHYTCHSTLTPARTPGLHYTCHSTLTPARTPRLHHNVVMWGLSSAMISALHNSVHPPETELHPTKMAYGCHCGGGLTPSLPQPVTCPSWKMHGRPCKEHIFWSYNKTSTFNAKHFDENPAHASAKKKTKRLKGFIFRIFIGHFQVTPRQWRG